MKILNKNLKLKGYCVKNIKNTKTEMSLYVKIINYIIN